MRERGDLLFNPSTATTTGWAAIRSESVARINRAYTAPRFRRHNGVVQAPSVAHPTSAFPPQRVGAETTARHVVARWTRRGTEPLRTCWGNARGGIFEASWFILVDFGARRPAPCQSNVWSRLADMGPILAGFGPTLDQFRAKLGRARTNFGRRQAHFGRGWSHSGHCWALPGNGRPSAPCPERLEARRLFALSGLASTGVPPRRDALHAQRAAMHSAIQAPAAAVAAAAAYTDGSVVDPKDPVLARTASWLTQRGRWSAWSLERWRAGRRPPCAALAVALWVAEGSRACRHRFRARLCWDGRRVR